MPIQTPKNILQAKLAEESPVQLHKKLSKALESTLKKFGDQFFEGLAAMVDESLLGLVEWTGNNSCKYHFFRYVVIQKIGKRRTRSRVLKNDSLNLFGTAWKRRITTTTSWKNTHRIARHEHHALDTFVTSIGNSDVVMPPNVQKLVQSIPDWLREITRVVDGTLIRELIVEQDVRNDSWEQASSRDEPVYDCEPAVIIDQFVLTGWGPREINRELNRRREAKTTNRPQRSASFWLAVGLLTQVISFLLLRLGASNVMMFLLMWTFFCAGIPCWVKSLEANSLRQGLRLAFGQPFLFAAGMSLFSGGFHMGLVSHRLHLDLIGILATVACFGVAVGLLFLPQVVSRTQSALENIQ